MTVLTLPMPPSVNSLYSGIGRRYKSKKYQRWEIAARNALRVQPFTLLGKIPLKTSYRFGRPDMRTRDLSNLLKAIDDFMVHEGVISDDSWIHHITAQWDNVDGAHIEISPL